MEEIIDLFDGNEETVYHDAIMDTGEPKEYYIGKAEFILKQLNDNNYYEFLKVILKKYHELEQPNKDDIIEFMNIPEKIKVVEKIKIVYKEKKTSKSKLNNYDDY